MIPITQEKEIKDDKVLTFSALQLTRGVKKGETTYVATLMEEKGDDGTPPPREVEEVS